MAPLTELAALAPAALVSIAEDGGLVVDLYLALWIVTVSYLAGLVSALWIVFGRKYLRFGP